MKQWIFTVTNKTGIHLKPATMIAQKALEYDNTEILIEKDDVEVDAKSVTNILTLGACFDSKVTISISGESEEQVLSEIISVIESEDI